MKRSPPAQLNVMLTLPPCTICVFRGGNIAESQSKRTLKVTLRHHSFFALLQGPLATDPGADAEAVAAALCALSIVRLSWLNLGPRLSGLDVLMGGRLKELHLQHNSNSSPSRLFCCFVFCCFGLGVFFSDFNTRVL